MRRTALLVVLIAVIAPAGAGEARLGVLFDAPEATPLLAALRIFPADSAWHEDVSALPVHARSAAIIASIGADKKLACNRDMAFVIIAGDQPRVPVTITAYPDESDPGPFPIPDNAPIEDWPLNGVALDVIQRTGDGDRHLIVVDPANGRLHEFWQARRTAAGWQASCAATFDLTTNRLRPQGWTSSDAAGLPIFPAVVRYDELERGVIDHALRFTVTLSRKSAIYPATHHAGKSTSPDVPAMGERLRLKAGVDLSAFPQHAKVIAEALKKHGMIVADNGGDWRLSIAPDRRITGLEALSKLKGGDFEVVQTTGPNEGPRKR